MKAGPRNGISALRPRRRPEMASWAALSTRRSPGKAAEAGSKGATTFIRGPRKIEDFVGWSFDEDGPGHAQRDLAAAAGDPHRERALVAALPDQLHRGSQDQPQPRELAELAGVPVRDADHGHLLAAAARVERAAGERLELPGGGR